MRQAHDGRGLAAEFAAAFANGRAFLDASEGLRGRRPLSIEWKGSHRAPGDEVAPIDLRIDHVFLVSCKYLSRILINASPFHLFDRLLQGSHGAREADWYGHVAADAYQALYEAVCRAAGLEDLPREVGELRTAEHRQLSATLAGGWPPSTKARYDELVGQVSTETATRWRERASSQSSREALYWRLLRMGSAPYFVLGASSAAPLRLRVATPWDWRLQFKLRSFDLAAQPGGQPRVGWRAVVEERHTRVSREVIGHVEIRWSHGRFSGNPEAKVYLDTAHGEVPGYFALR